ncbi:hypothetical protein GPA22_02740 [Aromatoleum toluvorans]|uniref:Ribbon-helix-helix protein CopG domain-containing protein n=1 Tax=Aromatoleum toluvorans TaxID=92002 RepID=A0ABX1PX06_9RHOO|nr:hypothetical protein [Aromatoleum toluvorans]NMG42651.1 hypothetical protein [Aromatoleum toluvorans]
MANATEPIAVLVTAQEKAMIAKMARDANLSMGEFLRRAAASFSPNDDEKMLERMIEQMMKTTVRACTAMDDALAFVDASNLRIKAMEAKRAAR